MTGRKSIVKITFILFIIAAGIFLSTGSVFAGASQFRLDADSLNLGKGESTNLTLSLINAQGAEVIGVTGLENFDVVSSNQSTSTQIINGDTTYQVNLNYVVMPKNAGQFTLCGNVKYNGQTYKTNELKINVSQAGGTEKGTGQDLFVKTVLSKNEVYLGQKVVLTYELYSRYNIENFGFLDKVNIDQFICKEVPQDKLKSEYVYIDGNKYVKYEAKQMYLSPIKPGTFDIPAYKFQVNVSTGGFFNSSKPYYLQTNAEKLTVKPLPPNPPADFSGVVGKLNLEAKYTKQEVNYGDSLALQVTASGDCNLDNLKKIIKNDIPGFSVYETEKNPEESIENNQYKIKKEFEVILVPEKNGDVKIDPMYISYFNPESGNYEKAEIPGTTIAVKGQAPQPQTGTGVKSEEGSGSAVETIKIDQVNYKPSDKEYLTIQFKKGHLFMGLTVFIILLLLAAAAFWWVLYRKKHDKELLGIYKQIKNTDDQNEIYNLFNSMIKYRFHLSLKASSRDVIVHSLAGYELAAPVLEIMDYMENKKSHPDKGSAYLKDKIKEIYQRLTKLK